VRRKNLLGKGNALSWTRRSLFGVRKSAAGKVSAQKVSDEQKGEPHPSDALCRSPKSGEARKETVVVRVQKDSVRKTRERGKKTEDREAGGFVRIINQTAGAPRRKRKTRRGDGGGETPTIPLRPEEMERRGGGGGGGKGGGVQRLEGLVFNYHPAMKKKNRVRSNGEKEGSQKKRRKRGKKRRPRESSPVAGAQQWRE